MEAVRRVVELNEAAVIGLHEGKADGSAALLRDALNLYRRELTGDAQKDVAFGPNGEPHDHVLGVQLNECLCENDSRVTPDNVFSAFNCAFCFMEDVANVDSIAVVTLYNYGLSLHRKGMVQGNETDLRRALQFYAMSYGLLQDEAMSTRYQLGRVGLALATNQAQLYYHFMEFSKVQYCLDDIQRMLEDRSQMNLGAEEFGFFFHIVFFSSKKVTASPAA